MADPATYRPSEIPEFPGVYRFYNQDEKVIYVGKAKNLKTPARLANEEFSCKIYLFVYFVD